MNTLPITVLTWAHHPSVKRLSHMDMVTRGLDNRLFWWGYGEGCVGGVMDGEECLGMILIHHMKRRPYSTVYFVMVHPERRGRGYGTALLDWALQRSPHSALLALCSEQNAAGQRYYARQGWADVTSATTKAGHRAFYKQLAGGSLL